jgi:FkbM family methyltransferase
VLRGYEAPAITEGDLRDIRDGAYVRAFLRENLTPISVCVDVGAHRGAFLRQFLEFAPQGTHHAFEAIPKLASHLRTTFPTVAVHEQAVSDHIGTATFHYVPELPGWSGLRPQPYPVTTHPQMIPVTLTTLDKTLPPDLRVEFLKIDVEGAELEVLAGAHEMLCRHHPVIYFECAKIHHASYVTTPEQVYDYLTGCGYHVTLLDKTILSRDQFRAEYERSHASGYDRTAWGNYWALYDPRH